MGKGPMRSNYLQRLGCCWTKQEKVTIIMLWWWRWWWSIMAISPCITLSTSVAQTLWGWCVGTEPWSGCIARESMRKYPNNKFQIFEYQKYEMSYNIIESTHKYRNTNFKQCFKCQTKTISATENNISCIWEHVFEAGNSDSGKLLYAVWLWVWFRDMQLRSLEQGRAPWRPIMASSCHQEWAGQTQTQTQEQTQEQT